MILEDQKIPFVAVFDTAYRSEHSVLGQWFVLTVSFLTNGFGKRTTHKPPRLKQTKLVTETVDLARDRSTEYLLLLLLA